LKPPPVQYTDTPEGKVAYQVVGDGQIDLVFGPTFSPNLDMIWEQPALERFLRRLASFSRLILFNRRGTGLSDSIPRGEPPAWEEWVEDLRWVLDSAGSKRAALLAEEGFSIPGLVFAASYPERIQALVLLNCYASLRRHDDYEWGFPEDALERWVAAAVAQWGTGGRLATYAPELANDERFTGWFARLERSSYSPSTWEAVVRAGAATDVRGILPVIKPPTLVISHAGHPWVRLGHGRYLAEHIPNAHYVERPGFWGFSWLHDADWTLDEVQAFFTGTRGATDLDDRVLATVLFTDIVGSTQRAANLGDQRWQEILDEHDTVTRREIERFRGRLVKSTGDGVLATFDGPARAIRCGVALTDALRPLDIEVRTGVHTGEVQVRDADLGGIAVHIADRVMGEAGPGEVLVSGAVPPLVAGSGIEFVDRGVRSLKGVPGEWRLFAVNP
jgi:class 3 adenylate cyclase/pimeloyl-ACP methyl ester carboxylesterase